MERFSGTLEQLLQRQNILRNSIQEWTTILREFERILKETFLVWGKQLIRGIFWQECSREHGIRKSCPLWKHVLNFMQKDRLPGISGKVNGRAVPENAGIHLGNGRKPGSFRYSRPPFPGSNWSYSVKELKKEPFYLQLKMLKNYSTFFEKSPDLRRIVDFIGRREFDPPC